jgi:cysteinyl-tRNA synthetase
MAKSLKNFITIQEVLKKYTARQLRLTFLLHSWKDTLDYSDDTMAAALTYEKTVGEFFLAVKHIMRSMPAHGVAAFTKWGADERVLNDALRSAMAGVHVSLCDSVDTRAALDNIRELVASGNAYFDKKKSGDHNRALLKDTAAFITRIFSVFGMMANPEVIGFPAAAGSQGGANVRFFWGMFSNTL